MKRTSVTLSDGRELLYFDPDDAPERTGVDQRGLEPGSTAQGTMRFDVLTGEWVSVAGHRQSRIFLPSADACPICPTTPGNLSEIPEAEYHVAVFENRFPSFLLGGAFADTDLVGSWGEQIPAHGRCEVVAFTDDHSGSIASLTPSSMGLVMDAWVDRTRELSSIEGIRYVFVFENRGADVGVTLHHPHGQVYAYPYLPPSARTLLREARAYREANDRSMLADLVDFEVAAHERVVFSDEHWVAFVPYAARWPYEIQIHPLRDIGSLVDLEDRERAAFCEFFPHLIRSLDTIFDTPFPYMAGWQQRPVKASAHEAADSRLFLRLISNRRSADKLKFLAGSESIMGAFINDVTPETAAAQIRSALASTP